MPTKLQRFLPVALLITASTLAFADDNDGRIFRADVDLSEGLIFINGQDLVSGHEHHRREPRVVLGSTRLHVLSFSRTDIVATVPSGLAPATYLLRVDNDLEFAV